MKLFLKNCILFALGFILLIGIGLLLPNNSPTRSIDYSIRAKHEMLSKNNQSQLILTGGSNVLFGYNSQMLSDSLDIGVVNHAIHAGYGLKYILDDLEKFVDRGDIIILSPEYSHFFENKYLGSEPLLFSLTACPENINLLSFKQMLNIAPYIPKFALDRMKSFTALLLLDNETKSKSINVYSEHAINLFGDNKTHWDKKNEEFEAYSFQGDINYEVFEYISNFECRIEQKGARLYITYPSLCTSGYNLNQEKIDQIDKVFSSSKLKVLGKPETFIYRDSLFFDSPYHLNGEGVVIRTKKLLSLLETKVLR